MPAETPAPRLMLEGRRWAAEGLGDYVDPKYRPRTLSWTLVHELLAEQERQLRADFELELEWAHQQWLAEALDFGAWFADRRARLIYERLTEEAPRGGRG